MTFQEARECVIREVNRARVTPKVEQVALESAGGRVLAAEVRADRDYPPLDRSTRDGFAVRSDGLPGELRIVGEIRAGETFAGRVNAGEAVEIMTGAPIPNGADTVVMIEHVERTGANIRFGRTIPSGQFVNPRGAEARAGQTLLPAGKRLAFTDIALLATVGCEPVPVYRKPRVAILATGDEIVSITETPLDYQIRNSNVYSLAMQVTRAGGVPEILAVAKDNYEDTRALVDRGLSSDMLILSGGVSAGKYDIVEKVLAGCGAEFYFDRVAIQPGQPLVFGRARKRFFFGLPGNPASTMVTFELFARAALELLAGQAESALPFTLARLTQEFRHKKGLTRFLPAFVSEGASLTPVPWKGSSDVPALCRANAFMVADADREAWSAGDFMPVLLK
ncbi:MAG: molybdopterin molybdotransferase MoeA [Acidobacteriota bacterium]|nr:molybdopterin molybdotransferase MoeA [Acidobacteriota bacterium]